MKNSEILNIINEIEKNFPVNTWKIADIEIWPIVRIELMFQMFSSSPETKKPQYRHKNQFISIFQEMSKWLSVFLGDYKHNEYSFAQNDVSFSSHMADRNVRWPNGLWHDHNMDCLKEYLMERHQLKNGGFELIGNTAVVKRASNSFPTFPLELYAKVVAKICKGKKEFLPQYEAVIAFLMEKGIRIKISKKMINNNIKTIVILSDLIESFIKNSSVKLAFCMCYYSSFQFAYILACKRLKISVIDVQHGIAGASLHPAYASWQNVPPKGYQLLPDFFWCWTEDDFNAIDSWSRKIVGHRPILGGNMEVIYWLNDTNELTNYYDEILQKQLVGKGQKLVLLGLQKGIQIPVWVLQAIQNNRNSSIIWLVRFHPGHTQDDRASIIKQLNKCKNIEIELANNVPLCALLRNVDVHITDSSSIIIDALPFGVDSISYGLEEQQMAELFQSEVRGRNLMFAKNQEELLWLIENTKKREIISKTTIIDSKLVLDDLVRKFCL